MLSSPTIGGNDTFTIVPSTMMIETARLMKMRPTQRLGSALIRTPYDCWVL